MTARRRICQGRRLVIGRVAPALVLLLAASAACTTTRPPDPRPTQAIFPAQAIFLEPVVRPVEEVSLPPATEIVERDVGEPVIESRRRRAIEALVPRKMMQFPQDRLVIQLEKSAPYELASANDITRRYCRRGDCFDVVGSSVRNTLGAETDLSLSDFEKTTSYGPLLSEGLRRQLVYTGRNGRTATFSYREFLNDMARPAFTQELNFDLSSDKIIGFRGTRVEIIDATNTRIRYRVLKGFGTAS